MRDGHLEASGHNWVEGQGSGPRIGKKEGEDDDQYDAMGNKIDTKKNKKLTANEARKVCYSPFCFDDCLLTALARLRRTGWRARKRARLSAMTSFEIEFHLFQSNRPDSINFLPSVVCFKFGLYLF